MKSLADADYSRSIVESSSAEWERLLRFLPILGPVIANVLRALRLKPVVESIENELRRRKPPPLTIWSDDTDRALFAQSICELAMLEMGWPNDHFLPDDPASIVFWNHRDNLDFAAALKDIEFNVGVSLKNSDVIGWFNKSLGEVVDDLWEKRA